MLASREKRKAGPGAASQAEHQLAEHLSVDASDARVQRYACLEDAHKCKSGIGLGYTPPRYLGWAREQNARGAAGSGQESSKHPEPAPEPGQGPVGRLPLAFVQCGACTLESESDLESDLESSKLGLPRVDAPAVEALLGTEASHCGASAALRSIVGVAAAGCFPDPQMPTRSRVFPGTLSVATAFTTTGMLVLLPGDPLGDEALRIASQARSGSSS